MGYSQRKEMKAGFISPLLALVTVATLIFSAVSACDDVPPDSKFTCSQQKAWGKCGEPWMQGKCSKSCGRCSGSGVSNQCDDVPPDSKFTCSQQKAWGKCGEPWMQGKCSKSCGRCSGSGVSNQCDDVPPDSKFTCSQQKAWGKCGEPWMQGKCSKSCGRCPSGSSTGTEKDMKGRATHHHPTNNQRGKCGHYYNPYWNGGNWVAVNGHQWKSFGEDDWGGDGKYNRNPICSKTITIRSAHNNNAVERNVRVIDQCPECGMNNLDISRKLYKQFNKGSLNSPDGRIDIIWSWD